MGDSHMGLQARMMSQGLRKLTAALNKNKVLIIFINQLRMKIGVMFGNPETTTGGNALKFYASIRLDVRRSELIKDGDIIIGHKMKVKVVKTKVGRPFTSAEIPLIYGQGFSRELEVYETAVDRGVIEKSGGSHSFKGEKIAKSRAECMEKLTQNKSLLEEVMQAVRDQATSAKTTKKVEDNDDKSEDKES
jgi:recombination protein RecA